MLLRPLALFLVDPHLKELIQRFRRLGGDFLRGALVKDFTEVLGDGGVDAGFLPGFSFCGVRGGRFVGFPAAFGEDPGCSAGGLDEEDEAFVGGEGDNAGDEAFAGVGVACGGYVSRGLG